MRKINLIPMAGNGKRFLDGGYIIPKPLIKINGMILKKIIFYKFIKFSKIF